MKQGTSTCYTDVLVLLHCLVQNQGQKYAETNRLQMSKC